VRSKRYALVIEDGKVKEAHVEPDNTGISGMWFLNYTWTIILTLDSLCCGEGVGLNWEDEALINSISLGQQQPPCYVVLQ
jgi:hypothetical protein